MVNKTKGIIMEEKEIVEVEAILLSGEKKFNYPKLGEVIVKFPTIKEDIKIKQRYSEVYDRLLRETSLPTSRNLRKILEEKGHWTEDEETKLRTLQELYLSKTVTIEQIKLKKRKTDEDKSNLTLLEKERLDIYQDFLELSVQKGMLFNNTIEQKAEEEAVNYKLYLCCFHSDGKMIWEDYEDLVNSYAIPDFDRLLGDCIEFWRGADIPLSESYHPLITGNSDIE